MAISDRLAVQRLAWRVLNTALVDSSQVEAEYSDYSPESTGAYEDERAEIQELARFFAIDLDVEPK